MSKQVKLGRFAASHFVAVDADAAVVVVQDSRQDEDIPQVPKHWEDFRHMGDIVSKPVRSDPTPRPGRRWPVFIAFGFAHVCSPVDELAKEYPFRILKLCHMSPNPRGSVLIAAFADLGALGQSTLI